MFLFYSCFYYVGLRLGAAVRSICAGNTSPGISLMYFRVLSLFFHLFCFLFLPRPKFRVISLVFIGFVSSIRPRPKFRAPSLFFSVQYFIARYSLPRPKFCVLSLFFVL